MLFITVVTLVDCINTVHPDVNVTYMGRIYFDQEFSEKFKEELSPYIEDINGDEVKSILFTPLTISDEFKSEQDFAIQQKAQLEIAVGETFLFLMDEEYYEIYKDEGLFLDISQHIGESEPTYGFLLSESAIMRNLGIGQDANIYACVRVLTQGDEEKQKKVGSQNNAIKIISELYKKD